MESEKEKIKQGLDEIVSRKNTNSIKYKYKALDPELLKDDVIQLWVADMEFPVSNELKTKFHNIVDLGIFGYNGIPEEFFTNVENHFKSKFHYEIPKNSILKQNGTVTTIPMTMEIFSEKDDYILVQTPLYYLILEFIKMTNRKILENPLKFNGKKYEIDFEDFEEKCQKFKPKIFLLVNPHNPTGRVFTKEELEKMCQICLKYNVLIVSDEIYMDFVFKSHKHIPIFSISEEVEQNSIIISSCSKSFNVSEFMVSFVIVPNPELRQKIKKESYKRGLVDIIGTALGVEAHIFSFSQEGKIWLEAVIEYVWENYLFLHNFFKNNLPNVVIHESEGTYLFLMDFSKLNLEEKALEEKLKKSKVHLNDLKNFFAPYYLKRINLACPRNLLKKAAESFLDVFKN